MLCFWNFMRFHCFPTCIILYFGKFVSTISTFVLGSGNGQIYIFGEFMSCGKTNALRFSRSIWKHSPKVTESHRKRLEPPQKSPRCIQFVNNSLWTLSFVLKDPVNLVAPSWGTATLDPEPTQHSKPTFVWAYIADTCGYIQSDMRVHTYIYTATTLESYARCSRYLIRLTARNKLTLLTPDISDQTVGSKQTHFVDARHIWPDCQLETNSLSWRQKYLTRLPDRNILTLLTPYGRRR